jgi:hypothetical protein
MIGACVAAGGPAVHGHCDPVTVGRLLPHTAPPTPAFAWPERLNFLSQPNENRKMDITISAREKDLLAALEELRPKNSREGEWSPFFAFNEIRGRLRAYG